MDAYKIIRLNQAQSTQDEARKILDEASDRTVVLAISQTGGKGKPGSLWFSPEGGLYCSIILKPKKTIQDLLIITHLAAEAVVKTLGQYGIKSEIKEPNDVMVSGKKICGILTEVVHGCLIVGIGVNLNISEFPNGFNAISTKIIIGKDLDINEFLSELLEIFDIEYLKMLGNNI